LLPTPEDIICNDYGWWTWDGGKYSHHDSKSI